MRHFVCYSSHGLEGFLWMAKNSCHLSPRICIFGYVGIDGTIFVDSNYRLDGNVLVYGIAKFFLGCIVRVEL